MNAKHFLNDNNLIRKTQRRHKNNKYSSEHAKGKEVGHAKHFRGIAGYYKQKRANKADMRTAEKCEYYTSTLIKNALTDSSLRMSTEKHKAQPMTSLNFANLMTRIWGRPILGGLWCCQHLARFFFFFVFSCHKQQREQECEWWREVWCEESFVYGRKQSIWNNIRLWRQLFWNRSKKNNTKLNKMMQVEIKMHGWNSIEVRDIL